MHGFYHYTSAKRWAYIQNGEAYSGRKGLLPIRRFQYAGAARDYGLPQKAEEAAVFGLLEPMPQEWVDLKLGWMQPLLDAVISNIPAQEIVLLYAALNPQDDAYVADWGVYLRSKEKDRSRETERAAGRAYYESLTPFFNYKGGHAAPEAVCFSGIPLNRVKLIDKQPRWKLINRIRKGLDLPLKMPQAQNAQALAEILGLPQPDRPASSAAAIIPFRSKPA